MNRIRRSAGPRLAIMAATAAAALTVATGAVWAASDASTLPPNWHIHDGRGATLGPQHKGVGFFPTILGLTTAQYLEDPARCPDATDKAFLDSADTSASELLRAGVCMTGNAVIHLRTVPVGTAGPEGWASLTAASEPGYVTYYLVTAP